MRFYLVSVAAAVCCASACYQPEDSGGFGLELGQVDALCPPVPACSITETACQEAVLQTTACVRDEVAPELPSIRVITREQLREEQAADPLPKPSRRALAFRDALRALWLVDTQDSLAEAQREYTQGVIAAFYRLEEKDITVLSDAGADEKEAMNNLSHELTHYLQHRAGQLEGIDGPFETSDARVARMALIEGDATVTSLRATVAMLGASVSPADWLILMQTLSSNIDDDTNHANSPFLSAYNMLPYSVSLRALTTAWNVGGHAQVEDFFAHPPSTARDWLVSGPEPVSHEPAALRCNPPLAPEGYELLDVDTIGSAGLYALLGARQRASVNDAVAWKQDVMAIYTAQTTSTDFDTQVVWRIRLDSEQDAAELAATISQLGLQLTVDQDELTITASSHLIPAITEAQLTTCPSYEELKASMVPEEADSP